MLKTKVFSLHCVTFIIAVKQYSLVISSFQAFVVFATHFLDLTSLAANFATVEKYVLLVSHKSPILSCTFHFVSCNCFLKCMFSYHFSATTYTYKVPDKDEVQVLKCNHHLYKGPYRGPLYGNCRWSIRMLFFIMEKCLSNFYFFMNRNCKNHQSSSNLNFI